MTYRSNHFFSSDWHLFHKKSIEYDNRPFKSLDHMHTVLINNHNAVVPPNGVTFYAGDMGFAKPELMKPIIDQLNGVKVLILGNHDAGVAKMYRCGFDVVVYQLSLMIAKEHVTITHCPLRGITREYTKGMSGVREGEHWHGEHRHTQFSIDKHDGFHLHGHIHSPNGGKSKKIQGRQYDIGVVANNYRPVSSSEIESWIARTKKKEQENG